MGKKRYRYPTRPVPLGRDYPTFKHRSANGCNVAGAGYKVQTLMPARVRVETLHAIYARGVRVGRVDLATCIDGGFEIGLSVFWTARVTRAAVRGRCGTGGGSRSVSILVCVGDGGHVLALGGDWVLGVAGGLLGSGIVRTEGTTWRRCENS